MEEIKVSSLGKTWIFDIDGTIMKHNGYKLDGEDSFLPGALEFLHNIPDTDMIVFITSRTEDYREMTCKKLDENGIRYSEVIFGAPYGERILINDKKPSGLPVSVAVNTDRDVFLEKRFVVDPSL